MKLQMIVSILMLSHPTLSDVFNPDPSIFPDWSKYTKFDPEQYIQMKRLGSPSISPNRKQMVYQQYQYNKTTNSSKMNLRWVDISKGFSSAIDLTPNVNGQIDNSPIWINDNTVAFLAVRGSPNLNIFTVSTTDGSINQITNFTNGVMGIAYGSQAKRIAFISKVYKGKGIEESAAQRFQISRFPSSGVVYNKLFVRHFNEYVLGDKYQLFTMPISDQGPIKSVGDPVNVAEKYSGEWGLEPDSYNFSPDGKSILFSAKIEGKKEAWHTEAGVFQGPVDGSTAPIRLNPNFKGAASSPVYSPDGTSIAWLQMATPGYEADQNQIILYNITSQKQTRLIPDWEKSPAIIKFSDDSKKIVFIAPYEKDVSLFIADIATNKVSRYTSDGTVRSVSQIDDKSFVVTLSSMQFPDSLFILDVCQEPGKLNQLTFEDKGVLDKLWLSPTQTFWFSGAMNDPVQAMVLYPFGFDPTKKYPVIYLIHGGPQQSWNDGWSTAWSPNMYANQGFVVFIVNFHGGDAYGQKFTDSIKNNWGTYPYEDIMTGLDILTSNAQFVDPNNIVGIGESYGGYMINWLNGHTDKFKAFVNHGGIFNTISMYYMTDELWPLEHDMGIPWKFHSRKIYKANNPEKFTKNWKTPTLFTHGELDYRIPITESISAFSVLQRKGIDSKLLYFPNEDHFISNPPNQLKWLSEILGFFGSYTNTTVWQLN
ncbi:Dipeptidyl-peptidase 5 [Smittium mucronatum]|uniref:Dipeptidyl-peptidase V n=1 Tax=Smittium mucronatum TaxID=133383 RepID=A0A1R0H165_9FUNG|nr:Dipeptidyl-peptidase 5 [Smittium mucronatum]